MKFHSGQQFKQLFIGAFIVSTSAFGAAHVQAAFEYQSDQGHTEIMFGWNHAGVSMQHGEFTKADCTLILDMENIENSTINVIIDVASVSTGVAALDTHLKSASYFDVEKFPTATFESTGVRKTGDLTADVTGNLTIRGVSKTVTLKTTLMHNGSHPTGKYIDHYKGSWVGFSAETEIRHLEFGVGAYPSGTSDKIRVQISTEMKYQQK